MSSVAARIAAAGGPRLWLAIAAASVAWAALPPTAPAATPAAAFTAVSTSASGAAGEPRAAWAAVVPGVALQFPRDFGSHPQFGIEWWYVTGWLQTAGGHEPLGFQITFFRIRQALDAPNPSDFAPRQLLVGHCALSDPARGHLWQDQRIRRAGLGLAQAAEGDTRVWIDDWRLERRQNPGAGAQGAGSIYEARLQATDFSLQLTLAASGAPMLNGVGGFSQKGPAARSASDYYSQPHLAVSGSVVRAGRRDAVSGEAWLDHEWASEYLDPQAQGWDWVGLNLDDGGALMAFEIRDRRGRPYWAGGTLRDPQGRMQILGPQAVSFTPLRRWRSPRSGVLYPVAERVRAGSREFELAPLMDDQEFDARATSGALYWEGAVSARGAGAGRGYLELTGYDRPLSLR